MGRKTIYKNVTNEHNNVSKILVWHCLAVLTIIRVRGQIQYVFRFLTNENSIFMYKIVR